MRSEESSFIIYPGIIKNEIKNEISLLKNSRFNSMEIVLSSTK